MAKSDITASHVSHPMMSNKIKTLTEQVTKNAEIQPPEEIISEPSDEKVNVRPAIPGDLRNLLFLGKAHRDILIGDYVFKVATLTNNQQRLILSRIMNLPSDDRGPQIIIHTLAQAIISVNDVPLQEIYVGDIENEYDKKIEILSEMQSNIIQKLFKDYEDLTKESNQILIKDEVKK